MTQRGAMGGPPAPDGMSPSGVRSPSSRPADLPSIDIVLVNLGRGADRAEPIAESIPILSRLSYSEGLPPSFRFS